MEYMVHTCHAAGQLWSGSFKSIFLFFCQEESSISSRYVCVGVGGGDRGKCLSTLMLAVNFLAGKHKTKKPFESISSFYVLLHCCRN